MSTTKFKFGLCGTSSSGKTTLAYGLVARLKSYGLLADGVFNQDRKFSFDRALLETEEIAQHWMINNLIAKEVELSLHGDTDILVSDRTVLDLFNYYAYQYDTTLCNQLEKYIVEWAYTYDAIFYLPPLPYHADGKRPPETFRDAVDARLLSYLKSKTFKNVFFLERKDILSHILNKIEVKKPSGKREFTEIDALRFSDAINRIIICKFPKEMDTLSDYDIWVVDPYNYQKQDYKKVLEMTLKNMFGSYITFDVHPIPKYLPSLLEQEKESPCKMMVFGMTRLAQATEHQKEAVK